MLKVFDFVEQGSGYQGIIRNDKIKQDASLEEKAISVVYFNAKVFSVVILYWKAV